MYDLYQSFADGSIDTSNHNFHPDEARHFNIGAFDTVQENNPYILSPYDCSLERSMSERTFLDLSQIIHRFDTLTYTSSFIAAIAIALLISIHFRVNGYLSKGPSGSGLWTVFSAILKNRSMKVISYVGKCLLTLSSLCALVTGISLFVNLIKCGQISMYQPKVYHTLEDIFTDTKSIVMIDQEFRRTLHGNPLYSYHRDILVKKERTRANSGMALVQFALTGSPDHKAILSYSSDDPSSTYCVLKSRKILRLQNEDICFYSERIKGMVPNKISQPYSDRFMKKSIIQKYYKYTRRSFEMSLSRRVVYTAGIEALKTTNDVTDCGQKPPKTWELGHFYPILIHYYKLFFLALSIPLAVALIVLICEKLYNSYHHHSSVTPIIPAQEPD